MKHGAKIPVSLLLAGIVLLPACLPQRVSEVLGLSNNQRVFGRVVSHDGSPVADALIFVDRDSEAKATTNVDGRFEVNLSEADLLRLKGQRLRGEDVYYIYAQKDLPAVRMGISAPLSVKARGTRQAGEIKLDEPATIKGAINVLSSGGRPHVANAARVRVGRVEVITDEDGSFEVKGLPAGRVPMEISASQFTTSQREVTLRANESTLLPFPLVLFPGFGPSGTFFQQPVEYSSDIADLIQQGHPFMRTFFVAASNNAAFMRYTDKKEDIEKASWVSVKEKFEYEFGGHGGQTIYYQFADESLKEVSPVYQLALNVDLFADSDGIKINDGLGYSKTSTVAVEIDLPAAAFRMRISDDPLELLNLPWRALTDKLLFTFDPFLIPPVQPMVDRMLFRSVYVQFVDASGVESVVFTSNVFLDLFSSAGFIISNTVDRPGGALVTSRLLNLELNIPGAAHQVKIWDDYQNPDLVPWLAITPQDPNIPVFQTTHLLSFIEEELFNRFFRVVNGPRTVYVQYRDPARFESEVYHTSIFLDMFPTTGPVFTIEGQALRWPSKTVVLDLVNIPPNAKEMRIFESTASQGDSAGGGGGLGSIGFVFGSSADRGEIWLEVDPLNPVALYHFFSTGSKVLYLQFATADRILSPVYQQAIVIDPTIGDFRAQINGNASSTSSTLVAVSLTAPSDVKQYRIVEGNSITDSTVPFVNFDAPGMVVPFVLSDTPGSKLLTVQFRDEDNNLTAVTDSITYSP